MLMKGGWDCVLSVAREANQTLLSHERMEWKNEGRDSFYAGRRARPWADHGTGQYVLDRAKEQSLVP